MAAGRNLALLAFVCLVGCSTSPPYHAVAGSEPDPRGGDCATVYQNFDNSLKDKGDSAGRECDTRGVVDPGSKQMSGCLATVVSNDTPDGIHNACWHMPSEHHTDYDLFFTEFDDEGWEADLREFRAHTEIENLFNELQSRAQKKEQLDLVVYTHGWHGSSQSDNYYTVLFRAFLQRLARLDNLETPPRHLIGIFVGWRGDSIEFPTNKLSVWDRKLAAETVSAGAVQGLFERLHHFYLDYSCHPSGNTPLSGNPSRCGQVHMLTIGHSYGALINFRSLLGNMETGLNTGPSNRVYSFGDLVVLLNPAFEGTRYAPLYYSAIRRPSYRGPDSTVGGAQLPVVVTLQSVGDWATGDMFPLFRSVTTVAEDPLGTEKAENDRAMGWVTAFETHRLCLAPTAKSPDYPDGAHPKSLCDAGDLAPADKCDASASPPPVDCRVKMWAADGNGPAFAAVGRSPLYVGDGMSLVETVPPTERRPDSGYFPYWVVKVDKAVMKDHDDIWNPLTTELILQLYHAAVTQATVQATLIRTAAPK